MYAKPEIRNQRHQPEVKNIKQHVFEKRHDETVFKLPLDVSIHRILRHQSFERNEAKSYKKPKHKVYGEDVIATL